MEAFEHIVKVFLESQGYIVTTNVKFPVRRKTKKAKYGEYQTHGYEVDIVAAKANSLLLGSVKSLFGSRGVNRQGFKGIADARKGTHFDWYKIFNESEIREGVLQEAQKKYGYPLEQIRFCLFAGKFTKGHEDIVIAHLNKEQIEVYNLKRIMEGLVEGLKAHVSAAQFNLLTFVAWKVVAYDALGGSPQYKIRVTAGPTKVRLARTLIDGGDHGNPVLTTYRDRLICMWPSAYGSVLYMSSTSGGRGWTEPATVSIPTDYYSVRTIDLAVYDEKLWLFGVVKGAKEKSQFFTAIIQIHPDGDAFTLMGWNEAILAVANPSPYHRVSLASSDTRLWLAYVEGNSIRIVHLEDSSWSFPEIIHEFHSQEATSPSIAYCNNYLYVCYQNGSILTVRRRHETQSNWGLDNLKVNDAQVQANYGVDIHKISVIQSK